MWKSSLTENDTIFFLLHAVADSALLKTIAIKLAKHCLAAVDPW